MTKRQAKKILLKAVCSMHPPMNYNPRLGSVLKANLRISKAARKFKTTHAGIYHPKRWREYKAAMGWA